MKEGRGWSSGRRKLVLRGAVQGGGGAFAEQGWFDWRRAVVARSRVRWGTQFRVVSPSPTANSVLCVPLLGSSRGFLLVCQDPGVMGITDKCAQIRSA